MFIIKLSICKKLNYFEHYNILEYIENNQLNKFLSNLGEFSSLELHHCCEDELYVIIHPSTKNSGMFQVTYFDRNGPVSDTIHESLIECVKTVFHIYSRVAVVVK